MSHDTDDTGELMKGGIYFKNGICWMAGAPTG